MKRILLFAVVLAFLVANVSNAANDPSEPKTPAIKKVVVYTTAEGTDLRLTATETLTFVKFGQPLETQPCIFVDPGKTFQTFVGIGGAITDASAETFAKLPLSKQQEILQHYYDVNKGIGYTLARTNIHSCDFSSGSYTYVDDKDVALKTFSVTHDKEFRIPMIKQAIAAAGGKLTTYASPWSPPAWMKDSKNMLKGGKLLPEFYQPWAEYYVKFIKAYEAEGIPMWGLSVQF
jgi:glucosylceramidase